MWLMLQQERPEDYVIATGRTHSVEDCCRLAFEHVGLDWRQYVVQDPALLRPAEVEFLLGDASKARRELGWRPEVDFPALVALMVEHDLKRLSKT
jgi:GDPmannose 4,6-dehydratase